MEGIKESAVLNECLTMLRLHGIFSWRNNTGATKVGKHFVRFGLKGSADILGILPDGRFLAVECKREKGGVLSDCQRGFLDEIARNNGVAVVANSAESMMEQLKEYLRR